MGGSIGALPTENLLQMIGNLKLSTRLLLEKLKTKDYCLLTFRNGELIPSIDSSIYPSLKDFLIKDIQLDKQQLLTLEATQKDVPFWNKVLNSGLAERVVLKNYLIQGVARVLDMFKDLSNVHFELSPVAIERLGTSPGFSVTEICALSRKPASVPQPEPKPNPAQTTQLPNIASKTQLNSIQQPDRATPTASAPTATTKKTDNIQELSNLLRQLRDVIPGGMASYLIDFQTQKPIASSSIHIPDNKADFHLITELLCSRVPAQTAALININELHILTDNYLIGISFINRTHCLLAICNKTTQFGLMLTALRKANSKVIELINGNSL